MLFVFFLLNYVRYFYVSELFFKWNKIIGTHQSFALDVELCLGKLKALRNYQIGLHFISHLLPIFEKSKFDPYED
jgi:hypothetical protein